MTPALLLLVCNRGGANAVSASATRAYVEKLLLRFVLSTLTLTTWAAALLLLMRLRVLPLMLPLLLLLGRVVSGRVTISQGCSVDVKSLLFRYAPSTGTST